MSVPEASLATPDGPGGPGWFRRHLWGILTCLAFALTAAVYAPGLSGGWVLDDFTNIVQNPALFIHPWSYGALMHAVFSFDAGPLRRPVSMLTFALNRTFFGPGPLSFKITNLVLELVNGLLLLGFTRKLLTTGRVRWSTDWTDREIDYTALAVVTAWLLLPLNVTSVLYVVQREAALAATFTIAGAWFYLVARERQIERGGWMDSPHHGFCPLSCPDQSGQGVGRTSRRLCPTPRDPVVPFQGRIGAKEPGDFSFLPRVSGPAGPSGTRLDL